MSPSSADRHRHRLLALLRGGCPVVFAPFGLADLFALVVRANRVQITPAIYQGKVARWRRCWPDLTVLPWDDGIGAPRRA